MRDWNEPRPRGADHGTNEGEAIAEGSAGLRAAEAVTDGPKKIAPSGSKCRVPAAPDYWAPEIPSKADLADLALSKCELVHKKAPHFGKFLLFKRESGIRDLLVYCADYRCGHSIAISGDPWPDDLRLSDIEPATTANAVSRKRPAKLVS
jgi:hypothetical protein